MKDNEIEEVLDQIKQHKEDGKQVLVIDKLHYPKAMKLQYKLKELGYGVVNDSPKMSNNTTLKIYWHPNF